MKTVSETKSFGGVQSVHTHDSEACGCEMRFAVYTPPTEVHGDGPLPTLFWLSGLTCTEENFITKAGAQRAAAQLGLIIVAPDTSPRGDDVPDAGDEYDFGKGAGFYLDATQAPWSKHYRMYSYVREELPALIADEFPADPTRMGVFGHSMGGHGALTLHLKNREKFRSCSAFAPIAAPSEVPWGRKAFSRYLGEDEAAWADYDATALIAARGATPAHILIDQGGADSFLDEQLRPKRFAKACASAGQALTLRMQEGYDHSYYFIATFIEDHLRWHADALA